MQMKYLGKYYWQSFTISASSRDSASATLPQTPDQKSTASKVPSLDIEPMTCGKFCNSRSATPSAVLSGVKLTKKSFTS